MVLDRGYNATPAWHLVGHALASRVPVSQRALLSRIDLLLVVAMFGAIGWAYGRRVALIALVWLCVSFSASWPGVGWSFLRYDWLAAAVAGTCLLARGRRFLGGALLGWATLSRLFPGVLLLFLFVRGAHRLVARRELDRPALSIAAGFVLVLLVGLLATWRFSEPGQLQGFRHDLEIQLDNLSVNRMGVGVALAYRGEVSRAELPPARRRERFEEAHRLGRLGKAIGLLFLSLAAFSVASRGRPRPAHEDDDLTQMGFLGFALLLTASFYYWSLRLLAVLLHARHQQSSRWDRLGLTALFAIEIWSIAWHLVFRFQYGLIATTSICVTVYAAAACFLRGQSAWRHRQSVTGAASTPNHHRQ